MTNPVPILCVGLNCLDIVSDCASFPEENAKVGSTTQPNRCLSQKWERGGNASNTCTVLALLGSRPSLACTLANSHEKQFMVADLAKYGIGDEHIVYHDGVTCPSSMVICSRETGSRTIVHSNQNLPELTVEDFKKIPLHNFKWVHFEGRNVRNVLEMQNVVRETTLPVTISVELEKVRPDMELLGHTADVVFVSKEFAQHLGYDNMRDAAEGIANNLFKK
ncbi:Carbohydrate kinase PfkB [Trinorchestia longiramus]|nr:Carbohydrate kinase PfkB [Trinorchestia longiramus]